MPPLTNDRLDLTRLFIRIAETGQVSEAPLARHFAADRQPIAQATGDEPPREPVRPAQRLRPTQAGSNILDPARAGDIGVVKPNLGHYVENTGPDTMVFLEVFRAPRYKEVSLAQWLARTPPALVM